MNICKNVFYVHENVFTNVSTFTGTFMRTYLRPENAHKHFLYTCRKKMAGLSKSDVEKAHKAIAYLPSITVVASTTPTSSTNVGNLSSSETGKKFTPVMEASDKALDALREGGAVSGRFVGD